MVVFPSPAGVGVIAVTTTSLPSGAPESLRSAERSTFATWRPRGSISSGWRPISEARSAMGRSTAPCAISSEVTMTRY